MLECIQSGAQTRYAVFTLPYILNFYVPALFFFFFFSFLFFLSRAYFELFPLTRMRVMKREENVCTYMYFVRFSEEIVL